MQPNNQWSATPFLRLAYERSPRAPSGQSRLLSNGARWQHNGKPILPKTTCACVRVSWQRVVPRTKAGGEPEGQLIPTDEGESENWTWRGRVESLMAAARELERRMERETQYSCEALESCAAIAASPQNIPRVCPRSNSLPFLPLTVWLSSPLCRFKLFWPAKGKSGGWFIACDISELVEKRGRNQTTKWESWEVREAIKHER